MKGNLDMIQNATENDQELLGYLLFKCTQIAKLAKLENGYRLVINNGRDGGLIIRTNDLSHARPHHGRNTTPL